MDINILINQHTSETGGLEIDLLRKKIFSLLEDPIHLDSEDQLSPLLIMVVNLNYGKPVKPEELKDRESAADAFTQKVLNKNLKGSMCWLEIFDHIGTHQPKNQNDKVSSGAVMADWGEVSLPKGKVSSLNCGNGRKISGAGDSANNSHYAFLSLTISMEGQIACLMEWIGMDNLRLKQALLSIGMAEEQWGTLVAKAKIVTKNRNLRHLDRLIKQVFVPCNRPSEGYIQVSPLPSTNVIVSFENKRRKMAANGIRLPLFVTKVGGTKPWNAGTLPNELVGMLRHLEMWFPRMEQDHLKKWLYRIGHYGVFFLGRKRAELRKLDALLNQDWDTIPQSRRNLLTSLEVKISDLFREQLDRLLEVQYFVSSNYDHGKKESYLEQPEHEMISPWLRSFLDVHLLPRVSRQVQIEELIASGMRALKKMGVGKEDSHVALIRDALDKIVQEVVV
jgi:hypothetical protein